MEIFYRAIQAKILAVIDNISRNVFQIKLRVYRGENSTEVGVVFLDPSYYDGDYIDIDPDKYTDEKIMSDFENIIRQKGTFTVEKIPVQESQIDYLYTIEKPYKPFEVNIKHNDNISFIFKDIPYDFTLIGDKNLFECHYSLLVVRGGKTFKSSSKFNKEKSFDLSEFNDSSIEILTDYIYFGTEVWFKKYSSVRINYRDVFKLIDYINNNNLYNLLVKKLSYDVMNEYVTIDKVKNIDIPESKNIIQNDNIQKETELSALIRKFKPGKTVYRGISYNGGENIGVFKLNDDYSLELIQGLKELGYNVIGEDSYH